MTQNQPSEMKLYTCNKEEPLYRGIWVVLLCYRYTKEYLEQHSATPVSYSGASEMTHNHLSE